jgi:hypothetical protein
MNLEAIELAHITQGVARPGLRWGSIFAGTCVGIAVYILAMLVGICVGSANGLVQDANASVAALAWNLVSALGAAVLGTFVAARSADLRHASEGAMHGLVVWACAALLVMLVGLLLVHDLAGSAIRLMAQNAERETALAQIDRNTYRNGLRTTAFSRVSDTPGEVRAGEWVEMSTVPNHAQQSPDQGAGMPGVGISAYAALMICAALAISLFGGIAGGLLGTRAPRGEDPLDHADWRAVLEDF